MKEKNTRLLLFFVAFLLPLFASAHHSHSSLNSDDVRLYHGVVTRYSWRAPHIFFQADVAGDDGLVRNYTVEALNPSAMQALGWSKESFAVGDVITWEGPHDKDLDRPYAGVDWAETADGTRLLAGATDFRTAQRNIDAAIASTPVEPATALGSGSWVRIAADGGPHPFVRKPATDWPLTPEAQQAVKNFNEDDTPVNECVFGGPPRNIISLSNYSWSRPDNDTILIDRDMWDVPRVIYLGNAPPKGEPSSFGYSVGRFAGDELIVDTDNFVAETWGMYTGIDSTAQKKLHERYWLSEGGMRLNVEFTVEDPGVLTRPYSYTHQWKKVPDRELVKVPCTLESAWLYKTAGYTDQAGVDPAVAATPTADTATGSATTERGLTWWLIIGALIVLVAASRVFARR
jgi:hypothetical protein